MSSRTATALLAIVVLGGCAGGAGQGKADLVLLNGKLITVDPQDRIAEAAAISGGRIAAVGTTAEIRRWIGPKTTRVDLKGLAATPGLLDAHNHFAWGGLNRLLVADLGPDRVKGIGDAVRIVRDEAAKAPAGAWVQGRGWDEGKLAERRYIFAADLDSVSGDHPVWLEHTTGHYGVANSAALRRAGINRASKDPPRGTIDRYPDGTPTGVLKEAAQDLVARLIPDATPSQLEAGIEALAKDFVAEGMTGLKDPGISAVEWNAYKAVLAQGALPVRVFALWQGGNTLESVKKVIADNGERTRSRESLVGDHLIAGGVKLYMDGSGGARTAWMYQDWNKASTDVDRGNRGYPATDPAVLREQIRLLHDAGIHVSVHAIGDQAIDWVVDSYREALTAKPTTGLRHGIIHANIPTDHALDVIVDLERRFDAAYPEPSATFMWWIGDTYAGNFGPSRSARLNPFKTFISRGIHWAGSSDFPVTPFPARYGVWASVTRQTLLGVYGPTPFGTAEAVDVRDALRSFTIWAAHQMFLDAKIGSLEPRKYADIAIWDRDPYTVPAAELKDLQCQMTLVDGRIVYGRPDAKLAVDSTGAP